MKKNAPQPNSLSINVMLKSISTALNSLFFSDNSREFQRLKNFIAS